MHVGAAHGEVAAVEPGATGQGSAVQELRPKVRRSLRSAPISIQSVFYLKSEHDHVYEHCCSITEAGSILALGIAYITVFFFLRLILRTMMIMHGLLHVSPSSKLFLYSDLIYVAAETFNLN